MRIAINKRAPGEARAHANTKASLVEAVRVSAAPGMPPNVTSINVAYAYIGAQPLACRSYSGTIRTEFGLPQDLFHSGNHKGGLGAYGLAERSDRIARPSNLLGYSPKQSNKQSNGGADLGCRRERGRRSLSTVSYSANKLNGFDCGPSTCSFAVS